VKQLNDATVRTIGGAFIHPGSANGVLVRLSEKKWETARCLPDGRRNGGSCSPWPLPHVLCVPSIRASCSIAAEAVAVPSRRPRRPNRAQRVARRATDRPRHDPRRPAFFVYDAPGQLRGCTDARSRPRR
jgi:hypothetical protein